MPQPTQYNRLYNFVTYALANPSAPYQPAYTDAEFNAIQTTLSQVLINLSLIQRDDGALKNGVVTQDSLSTSVAALFAAAGSTIRGAWLTTTVYALKDVVTQSNITYICAVAHTSGVFATDLAALKWVALNSGTTVSAANVTSTPSGDVAATNVDAAIAELASEKMAKSQNLADIPTRATAFTNLVAGGGTMTGALTFSGARINEAQGADIASAGTLNLDTATGNVVDVTGTTTITAVTLSQGREAVVRFTGVLTLTNGASLVLPSGASITTAAGDFATFRGYSSGVVHCVHYSKASGMAVVPAAVPTVVSVRQTVLSGALDANGYSAFGGSTGGTTVAISNQLIATAANGFTSSGTSDVIGATTGITWGNGTPANNAALSTNGTMYLGVTISGGVLTPFTTTVAPVYAWGGTPSTTAKAFTFNIQAMQNYLGNGSTADSAQNAVMVGEVTVSGGVVQASSIIWYALMGRYRSAVTAIAYNTLYTFNVNIGVTLYDVQALFRQSSSYSWAQVAFADAQNNAGVRYGGMTPGIRSRNVAVFGTGSSQLLEVFVGGTEFTNTSSLGSGELLFTANRGW